jgi:hypothetical protein
MSWPKAIAILVALLLVALGIIGWRRSEPISKK